MIRTWPYLGLIVLQGCVHAQTFVQVRDPGEVAVLQARTPSSDAVELVPVLPPRAAEGLVAHIPYKLFSAVDVRLSRSSSGAIALQCDGCGRRSRPRELMEARGRFNPDAVGFGASSSSDELVLRWSFPGGKGAHFPELAGEARTPWSNVELARERVEPSRTAGWLGLAGASLVEAAGAAMLAAPHATPAGQKAAPFVLGVGVGLDAFALWQLLARPTEQILR